MELSAECIKRGEKPSCIYYTSKIKHNKSAKFFAIRNYCMDIYIME
jgi:hypothetical protein